MRAALLRVERAVQFVEARLFEPLDTERIAGAVGGSVSELHRLFRRVHGMSLMAYVRARRLTEATRMLQTHDVLEVARRCGYSSQAAFTRAFRRQFGVPPGQWRTRGATPYTGVAAASLASLAHRSRIAPPETVWLHDDLPLYGQEHPLGDPEDPEPFVAVARALGRAVGDQHVATGLMVGVDRYYLGLDAPCAGLDVHRVLPAGLYLVFTHRGPAEAIPDTLGWIAHHLHTDLLAVVGRPHAERFVLGTVTQPTLELELWVGVEPTGAGPRPSAAGS